MWTYDDDLYKNQYYFGSQLLVCPILTKMDKIMNRTIHRFFIPEGVWYDFTTGKKFPGNKKYISFYREADYPVFAHAGSIIPLSNRSDYNNTGIPTDLEIQIFPGVSNTYNLYDDDGVKIFDGSANTSTSNLALISFLTNITMSSGFVHVTIGFPAPPTLAQAL